MNKHRGRKTAVSYHLLPTYSSRIAVHQPCPLTGATSTLMIAINTALHNHEKRVTILDTTIREPLTRCKLVRIQVVDALQWDRDI